MTIVPRTHASVWNVRSLRIVGIRVCSVREIFDKSERIAIKASLGRHFSGADWTGMELKVAYKKYIKVRETSS